MSDPLRPDPEVEAEHYRKMRDEREPDDGMQWILFIKETRCRTGCSIEEAHRIAWRDPHWRRWVQRRINIDPQCRKMAVHHLREHGDEALIKEEASRLRVREPEE